MCEKNSYLINEKLTDSQSVDLTELLPNISEGPSIPDTPICINGGEKDSVLDDAPTIPITDTPICNNQCDERSPDYSLSQPFILESLKQNYKSLYAQSVATKEFLLNEICSLKRKYHLTKN